MSVWHLARLQVLSGCLHCLNWLEQLHFLDPFGPTHLLVRHCPSLVQGVPPMRLPATASPVPRARGTAAAASPPSSRVRPRRERTAVRERTR
ncbi:MAG: hypothetical protein AVDCRST_MAG59-1193 [uncultured Thermomicrobiales bacterium]|uniref:Uncharacterized protein n=1 Tax=uncultured Thermomicrobiales bacterium TaxID=1645740 RepID=A0A6J4UAQ9_9BACT|nr:MAG: hypothetical protein AVDCRST_MAG59-1193 [uncultured Thermomicrobiales bacterium]